MAYSAVQAASFSGGLNLRDSYEQMEVNQAYDLLNVQFDNKGGVKSRPGFAAFGPKTQMNGAASVGATTLTVDSTDIFASSGTITVGGNTVTYSGKTSTTFTGCSGVTIAIADDAEVKGSAPNRYDSMTAYYTTSGIKHLVLGAGNRLEVMNENGVAVASGVSTSPTASPHYFTRFGGPTKTVVYAANGTDKLRQWNGSAWSTPSFTGLTDSPKGKFLAVTPWDNRLVNARLTGTVGGTNPSTVCFSDPSVPDTWQTYNWVDVSPGDGEQIMGMCSFDNYLIVFKETHYFVFYGTTINNEDGTPEFSYRAVEAGVGLAAPNALCVAPDGVYFLAENGVYKTNGGLPTLVSNLIDPLFTGAVPSLYSGYAINQSSIGTARVAYNNLQVFIAVPTGGATTNDRLLMYDLRNQSWTVWDIEAAALCQFRVSGSQSDLMFAYANTNAPKRVGRVANNYTSDDGVSITSRIKIAFNDFGDPTHKSIRESKVWGTGKVLFGLADDFGSAQNVVPVDFGGPVDRWSDGSDASDVWADGTNPDDVWANFVGTRAELVRSAVRGAFLSIELYGSNAESPSRAWSVNKIVHHLRDRRVPSVTNLDGE